MARTLGLLLMKERNKMLGWMGGTMSSMPGWTGGIVWQVAPQPRPVQTRENKWWSGCKRVFEGLKRRQPLGSPEKCWSGWVGVDHTGPANIFALIHGRPADRGEESECIECVSV